MPQRKAGFKKPKKAGAMGLHQETDKPSICVANFQCVGASHSKNGDAKGWGHGSGGGAEKVDKGGLSEGLRPCFIKAAFFALPG